MKNYPPALVVTWTSHGMEVLCPYCQKIHQHGIGRCPPWKTLEKSSQTRLSHCGEGNYRIFFPHESQDVASASGWELDKQEARFYAVKEGQRQASPHPVEERLVNAFRNLDLGTNRGENDDDLQNEANPQQNSDETPDLALEDVPDVYACSSWRGSMRFPSFRKSWYLSACALNELSELQHLFTAYDDDFASMVDEKGRNGFLVAAAEERAYDGGVLEYLKGKTVPAELPDSNGRTPLMEAALWARKSTVKYLLAIGADPNATDAQNLRAVDLAADTQENRDERISRAGGVYREPADADEKRKLIWSRLSLVTQSLSVVENTRPTRANYSGFFHTQPDGNLTYYKPDTTYQFPPFGLNKAFARLDRGSSYATISAMSGWSHKTWGNVLDNSKWTDKAAKICRFVGHKTANYYECHVEKQLIAYYLDRHVIFEAAEELDLALFTHASEDDLDCDGRGEEVARVEELTALRNVYPPDSLPQATITVNKRQVCEDCQEFIEKVKARFDIPLEVLAVGGRVQSV